jgi:hypothetical protein
MIAKIKPMNWLLGLAGAVGGGAVGFFVFVWLVNQGLYAMVVPGAALGAGGGFLFKKRSPMFGVVCAALALLLGLFAHWWVRIPLDDEEPGLLYLLTHLNHISAVSLGMIVLGGLCGFWFGQGQERIRKMQEE